MSQKGAIAMLACKHLSPEDCAKHPNCQWASEFLTKTGKTSKAHCASKAQPIKLTRASSKRMAAGRLASGTNPWVQHVKRVAAEQGISYRDAMQVAKASYVKPQKGGYFSQWGAGCKMGDKNRCVKYPGAEDLDACMLNPNTSRCTREKRVQKMYNVRKPASPKQLAALEKARAARGAKKPQEGGWLFF